jgi:hypothetical protein
VFVRVCEPALAPCKGFATERQWKRFTKAAAGCKQTNKQTCAVWGVQRAVVAGGVESEPGLLAQTVERVEHVGVLTDPVDPSRTDIDRHSAQTKPGTSYPTLPPWVSPKAA